MMGGGVITDEANPGWVEAVQGSEGAFGVPPMSGKRLEADDFRRVDRWCLCIVPSVDTGAFVRSWGIIRCCSHFNNILVVQEVAGLAWANVPEYELAPSLGQAA